jgi:glutathione S-transferase
MVAMAAGCARDNREVSTMLRVFGSELSPYSVKVRSYLRYKVLPHEWVPRHAGNLDEFQRHAKLPLIPLVLAPDGSAMQDSTPIIERLEAAHSEPSIHPSDPVAAFVSALIEEYGDEWGNKWMFHYRWTYEPDQDSAAERIAREHFPGAADDQIAGTTAMLKQRMVPRLSFVGSSPATRARIEASFTRTVAIIEEHLARRPYLFGARPAFADFGLWPQLYQCWTDPTPGTHLRQNAPRTVAWIERMLTPRSEGDFESWQAIAPTLEPLLREEIAGRFLPWSTANAHAITTGKKQVTTEIDGAEWTQDAQKYHAKSLAALKSKYAAARSDALTAALRPLGIDRWLT